MSFHNVVQDVNKISGSLSRSVEATTSDLSGVSSSRRQSQGSVDGLYDQALVIQSSCWANLPTELLRDVIRRLDESGSTWPSRKDIVACAAVCRSWRQSCKDVVRGPEFDGKLTFPVSLKQPGPRNGMIQCFIKRDKTKHTYHLYVCHTSCVLVGSGKFLLAAKRIRQRGCNEYVISMDAVNISKSSSNYVGNIRSNFFSTRFIIYNIQPPYNAARICSLRCHFWRFNSRRVTPKERTGSYRIAQVTYELNVLGSLGPRKINCIIDSIPVRAIEPGGSVPFRPPEYPPLPYEGLSCGSTSYRECSSSFNHSMGIRQASLSEGEGENDTKDTPLVLRNKAPRWHEQLQCWCLNFQGRVTMPSVKNFQLIAAQQPAEGVPENPVTLQNQQTEQDKVILQFGKVGRDTFTMDYRYPISAFQAFAICLTSFDTKVACE